MDRKSLMASALVLSLAAGIDTQAAADWDGIKSLIHAAYVSDSCREQAEALGITGTSDANAVFAAFAAFARPVDGERDTPDAQRDHCRAAAVLLTNVMRRNGVNAELVFASISSASPVDGSLGKIDSVLVFVPDLGQYFDPSMPVSKQTVRNQIIQETARRVHVVGPPLAGDAQGACRETCIREYSPSSHMRAGIKTELIRNR